MKQFVLIFKQSTQNNSGEHKFAKLGLYKNSTTQYLNFWFLNVEPYV